MIDATYLKAHRTASSTEVKAREPPVTHDKRRYKRRNRIETMFGRLKDWHRIATRYDRCRNVFLPAIALAATVLLWLSHSNESEA